MSHLFVSDGHQIVGQRDNQEDAFLIVPLDGTEERAERVLVILADGMGGHAAGQVASGIVVDRFREYFNRPGLHGEPPQLLNEALDFANRMVGEAAADNPAYHGMGCTVVAVLCEEDRLWWVSVGDSHLYLLRDSRVEKLNADHSYGGYLDSLEAKGEDLSSAQNLPRNMLMSAIVGDQIPMIDVPDEPFTLKSSDRLVLASDGLDTIAREELALRFDAGIGPGEFARRLVEAVEAVNKPRQDNTTVAVVEVRAAAVITESAREESPLSAPSGDASKLPMLAGGLVLLAAVAGGGYYYFATPAKTPPSDSIQESPATAGTPSAEPPEEQLVVEAEPKPPVPDEDEIEYFRDPLANGDEGPEMVKMLPGHFTMGRPQDSRARDEYPPHAVLLPAFAMARYETTVADYRRFAVENERPHPMEERPEDATTPITGVSWEDARAYAEWLSEQTGERYRLPSEAEWEYAAGAGSDSHYWWGYHAEKGYARCFDCGEQLGPTTPLPVGSFEANSYGLHDTAGNVAEWVQDCYHTNYNGAPRNGVAWQEEGCAERVVRGGSFANASSALRTTARAHLSPKTTLEDIGFRLARDLPAPE